jgi:hypothetical protein
MGLIIARVRLKQRCACAVYLISQNFSLTERLKQRSFRAIVNAAMYNSSGFFLEISDDHASLLYYLGIGLFEAP